MTSERRCFWQVAFLATCMGFSTHIARADGSRESQRQAAIQAAAARGEGLWRNVDADQMQPTSGCRSLVGYALTLAEARLHPERIARLLAVTRTMQDQNPKSKVYGNLRWYWRDKGVTDFNAVEFTMHDALLILIRHGDWIPADARKELEALVRLGVEGCLRHRVPTEYTNIAILNASNLIVLGERLDRKDAAEEGYRRLDGICALMGTFGVHEFCSPTYYGADLSGLLMVHTYARGERQRRQADALLTLFWTDIAANWFEPAQRLGGCQSRSYDYLRNLGMLDWYFWVQGWLKTSAPGSAERCEPWSDQWKVPPELGEMARTKLPRLVRQHWGILPAEARTHMIYPDISLSCCGAGYGDQDSTLTVDLPGERNAPRCYFIPDGREDPYGKLKYETGSAKHLKALHLKPFWAGAQRTCDAVGLVVYRASDIKGAEVNHLQSHFVLRRSDEIWLDGKRLNMPKAEKDKPAVVPLRNNSRLVLRYGTAAVGVCVPFALGAGSARRIDLIDDGNAWNCLRVTVDHGRKFDFDEEPVKSVASAAIWVRVGSGLASDALFARWRSAFEEAEVLGALHERVDANHVNVAGKDGPLALACNGVPWECGAVRIDPPPYQGVLEIDGREVGGPLLAAVEPLRSHPIECTTVRGGKAAYWEAASGLVLPGMTVIEDAAASGGRCVGQEHSDTGQPSGIALWSLKVEKAGHYWLWARVRSNDEKHGTFSIRGFGPNGVVLPPTDWLLRSAGKWRWKKLEVDGKAVPIDLPQGTSRIEVQTRQSGTQIDRLMLTDDPKQRP